MKYSSDIFMDYAYDGEIAIEGFKDRVKVELGRFNVSMITHFAKLANQFNRFNKISVPKSAYDGFEKLKTRLTPIINSNDPSIQYDEERVKKSPEYKALFSVDVKNIKEESVTVKSSSFVSEYNKLLTRFKKQIYQIERKRLTLSDKSGEETNEEFKRLHLKGSAMCLLLEAYTQVLGISEDYKKYKKYA